MQLVVASGPRKIAFKTLKCDSIDERRKEFLKEVWIKFYSKNTNKKNK
jgi:hypothetical protein